MECWRHRRAKGAAKAETHLGHSPAVEDGWASQGPRALQLSHRRQAAGLRDVAPSGSVRQRSTVIQQKTSRPVPFEITDATRDALAAWLTRRGSKPDDWLFPSRTQPGEHIGTRQALCLHACPPDRRSAAASTAVSSRNR